MSSNWFQQCPPCAGDVTDIRVSRRGNGLRWRVNFAVAGIESLLPRLDDPDAWLDSSAPRLGSNRKGLTETVRVILPEWPQTALVLKRYRPRKWWYPLKDIVRGSAAVRAFERGFLLRRLGVPTAPVIAASEQSPAPWGVSYLITEEVPLPVMLWDWIRDEPNPARRRGLARELGRLLARLHDAGLEHTDPSLTNFLVTHTGTSHPALVLIDLDGLRSRRLTEVRAAHGLRRLAERAHVTPRERLWCLAGYCRARRPPLDSHGMARLVGSVTPRPSSRPPPRTPSV